MVLAQKIGRGDEVADVRGKIGVGEVAFAPAQAGEVEAQHGDAALGERGADVSRRLGVLRAGEAVGEQGVGERRPVRRVEPRGKRGAGCAGKADGLSAGCHVRSSGGNVFWSVPQGGAMTPAPAARGIMGPCPGPPTKPTRPRPGYAAGPG